MTAATFDPTRNAIFMDLGTGPVAVDVGAIAALQAFIQRRHDVILRDPDGDRLEARKLRALAFNLEEAERDMRAHQREASPLFTIPTVEPLDCKVRKFNPKLWRTA